MQSPKFLRIEEVIRIHEDLINSFGGSLGIRDYGLLESAIAQPQVSFGGELLHPNIYSQAGAYLYHLTLNHPFIDGNKRTAFAVTDTFIRLNGYYLTIEDQDAYELVIKVATRQLNKQNLTDYLSTVILALK
ncbi:death-on-curing family protein [Gloeothece citriformis PCC 7424]|uniref:Death-on-curing family protein n=1 Tax=Gloeothece citriformis (strain PCC 7424) TaxID=65393 RepID=B7K8U2_GLOC7|nr:type II toxin-antitoxin system death-on-curing family toxin [Gloeothece citriformis]ACK71290.1 death-on-curing family protein [Gloeothece citriformis PCC 7424]